MKDKLVPITLLTGYLGAGKTTMINHVLNNQKGYKVAVIVNDIGEVNIDASLIENGGAVTEQDDSLVPLSNGCICCTLKVDLMNQIADLCETGKFDYILIEASGICEPIPIAQTITMLDGSGADYDLPSLCKLDNIVAVVDALRLVDEFDSGEKLLKGDEIDEDDIESLLIQQIEFCNKIVINKVDKVSEEQLKKVKAVIRVLQPEAEIIETNYGKVNVEDIMNTNSFDFVKAQLSAGWVKELQNDEEEEPEVDEYGISTFVYKNRKPFDADKLEALINEWPDNIIRSKGIIWFADEKDVSYIFEQAGKQIQASMSGKWVASATKAQQKELIRRNPRIKEDWDDKYGDRIDKIVIIGQDLDREKITKLLDDCLVDIDL